MTQTLFAKKRGMTEGYLGDTRVAVTKLDLKDQTVLREKTVEKDGYIATVVSMTKTHGKKPLIKEIASNDKIELVAGMLIHVQATSKGKGLAGVMKRWNFAGGPRTHGQSDRGRAPGSIGQGTTPGRVLRGRHMSGRMGSDTVTVRNLPIVAVDQANKCLWVAGPVPGHAGALVTITITKEVKQLGELKYLNGFNL